MLTSQFDYELPPDLIAQEACLPRDAARMLVAGRSAGAFHDQQVRDLPSFLRAGDVLVLNRTKVIPARLFGHKVSGGAVEILLIHPEPPPTQPHPANDAPAQCWRCLVRGRVQEGGLILFKDLPVRVTVVACHEDGERTLAFAGMDVLELAERIGHVPLPPYIRRRDRPEDRERYQTVFGDRPGSVAAPTASLHFTPELLQEMQRRGVTLAYVDLAIGPGTFKPVDVDDLADFHIHAEHCSCPSDTVETIQACRAAGGRVVAAGTTVVRTLESAAAQPGGFGAFAGWTSLFLHPPQALQVVDALLTNFHLPRSSLMMLVGCMCGVERLHQLYAHAIAQRYRFFSYGDAMLLLPEPP